MNKRYEVKEIPLEGFNGCYHIIDRMFGDGVRELFHYKDGKTKEKAYELICEVCERMNGIQKIVDVRQGNNVEPVYN